MARALLPAVCALLACSAAGCESLTTPDEPQFRTDAGRIEMDLRSRRRLEVSEHSSRRDDRGHLVARITFNNTSDKDYVANIRVRFIKAAGLMERRAYDTDMHRMPPGLYAAEWTSYTPDAVSYVVELRTARVFQ
jgi:hypothetical protein